MPPDFMVSVSTSSPETLVMRTSSRASDVWMLAASFWSLHNHDRAVAFGATRTKFGDRTQSSYRFEPLTWNKTEPEQLKDLIRRCYVHKSKRPSLDQIVNELKVLLEQSLRDEEKSPEVEGWFACVHCSHQHTAK
jgi:hypothetical protein